MGRFFKYPALIAVLVFLLGSCGRGEKIIPRAKLSEIYAEILVADQLIYSDYDIRRVADTSWVYEPILEKYGYDGDDYRASVAKYIKDPDRFARILRRTGVILEDRLKELKKEKEIIESMNRIMDETGQFAPERVYYLTGISNEGLLVVDSLGVYLDSAGGEAFFDSRIWEDTAWYGPAMVVRQDTVACVIDTLDVAAGEAEAADSLKTAPVEIVIHEDLKYEKNIGKIPLQPRKLHTAE